VVHEIGSVVAESARAVHSAVRQASFYAATVRHVLSRPGLSLSERLPKGDADSIGRYRDELTLEEVEEEAGPLLHELGFEP
jgi:hypothetical protein